MKEWRGRRGGRGGRGEAEAVGLLSPYGSNFKRALLSDKLIPRRVHLPPCLDHRVATSS